MKKYIAGLLILAALGGGIVVFASTSLGLQPDDGPGNQSILADFAMVLRDLAAGVLGEGSWLGQGITVLFLGGLLVLGLGLLLLGRYRRSHPPLEPLEPGQQFFVGGSQSVAAQKLVPSMKPARKTPAVRIPEASLADSAQATDKPLANQPVALPPAAPPPLPTPTPAPQPPEDDEVHPDGPDHIVIG